MYRPAAIDQLVKLGQKIDVPVFELGTGVSPVEIARQGVAKAKELGVDTVIVDTAGRLQVGLDNGGEISAARQQCSTAVCLCMPCVDAYCSEAALCCTHSGLLQ